MTTKSFKQMIADKEIKRADAMKIQLRDIHEEPGFNLRDQDGLDPEGVSFWEGVNALADYIAAGGPIPDLEVRPRDEGGVWVVDGHRRRLALLALQEHGLIPADYWVPVKAFTGTDAERVARVITSQEGRRLTDLEMALGCKRLAGFGWSTDQIARGIAKTRQRVEQLLVLAGADEGVQEMVKSGAVSGSMAVELVRKHGDEAAEVMGQELEKAQAQGKARVTKGTMKGPAVPRTLLEDLHGETTKLHQALSNDDHATIEAFHLGSIEGGTIAVPVERLLNLTLILEEAQRALKEKEERAHAKAEKAAQLQIAQEQLEQLEAKRNTGAAE